MAKKKSKLESAFLTEFRNSVKDLYPNSLWHKIADAPIFAKKPTRFTPPKPFDAFWIVDGKTVLIEAKVHKNHLAFSLNKVTKDQLDELTRGAHNGARAFVLINERHGRGHARVNRAFAIRPDAYRIMQRKRKSARPEVLEEYAACVLDYEKSGLSWPTGALLTC